MAMYAYRLQVVVDEATGLEGASIGAVAGWPTAEQYRRAAERCLALARAIEERGAGEREVSDDRSRR